MPLHRPLGHPFNPLVGHADGPGGRSCSGWANMREMTIRRSAVGLSVALALCLLAMPLATAAQAPANIPHIGYLLPVAPASDPHLREAFRQGRRELGYVEGQNIALETRWAEGKAERLPALAAELVRLKVDLIVAVGTAAAHAAKEATTTIPIVAVNVADPVGTGLVQGLARPGGNITGLSLMAPELIGKQLELLKEVLPKLSRVAVLGNPANPAHAPYWQETRAAGRVLGVQLHILEVRGLNELEAAFGAATKGQVGGLLVLSDPLFLFHRARIVALVAKHQLPAMYPWREVVDIGGLMSFATSLSANHRRAATYVDKLLKGAKPADLPVEQPTRFELVVNLKTAKALGLTIPQSVLIRADQVIQ